MTLTAIQSLVSGVVSVYFSTWNVFAPYYKNTNVSDYINSAAHYATVESVVKKKLIRRPGKAPLAVPIQGYFPLFAKIPSTQRS